jgi:CubicO group peptidase (beta-lactamase class C family)
MKDIASLDLERRVDRLLAPWDRPGAPGLSLALIRDGAFLLRRHVGLASIELGHRIESETSFRIASVTKQFTCLAVLLLASEGRLALGDDVRRHLPQFPDLGAPITIDQLMRNMSGIRDMLELMRMGGLELDQRCRPVDLEAAIYRQRRLNFAPGTRFLYSNSNFLLLGRIVERLAEMSLAEFFEQRIFRPLGMSQTRLAATTDEIIPGLATGYLERAEARGGFLRAGHAFPLGGEGGLVSTVEDLALWNRNYETGRVGGVAAMTALAETALFQNGRTNHYARGLEVESWRGVRTVSHGGLWPGFKTLFLRAPEKRLTLIAIANVDAIDVHALGHAVLDEALREGRGIAPAPALPPRSRLEAAVGRYLDRESDATLDIVLSAEGVPSAAMNGASFPLIAGADGRLRAHRSAFPLSLELGKDGLVAELDAGLTARFERVTPGAKLPDGLAGSYVNDELAAFWTIETTGDKTEVAVAGPVVHAHGWSVEPVAGDHLRVTAGSNWIRPVFDARIERLADGRIAGLRVSGGRVKNMPFRRVAE